MSDGVTVADVVLDAQSLLGDPNGEITQEILNDYATAYSELNSCLLMINAPEITRDVYYSLPANTNVIFPSQIGVADFGEPQQIWERGSLSTAGISKITDGTPLTVTFVDTPPGGNGSRIELNGIVADASTTVPDWVNRDWFITVTGAHTATLNGSVSMGNTDGTEIVQTPWDDAKGNGAAAMWSPESFIPMQNVGVQPFGQPQIGDVLGWWRWEENAIYVPGALLPRQIWIEYLASAQAPTSGFLDITETGRELKFLSHATAAHFAPKRQMVMGPQLAQFAYGPSGEADGSGGLLRQLIVPILKQKAQQPKRMQLFRRRRTQYSVLY